MTTTAHHHPALQAALERAVGARDDEALCTLLAGLSCKDRRTADYLLGEVVLPAHTEGEGFWQLFAAVVPRHPRAYLGTFLKAACKLYEAGRLRFASLALSEWAAGCSGIDRDKMTKRCLPVLRKPEEVDALLRALGIAPSVECAASLVVAGTAPCFYRLLHVLRMVEDDRLVQTCCRALVKRGGRLSFNMASILCQYFGLREAPGVFSLRVEPYELGWLDQTYSNFLGVLCRS